MRGLGTIINVAAIVVGDLIGLVFGGRLKERFRQMMTTALGLATMGTAIAGFCSKALVYNDGVFSTKDGLLMVLSLVIGALLGEALNLEGATERFGVWLKQKTGSSRDSAFVDGFVTGSCTVCIGAMAVMGSLMDGLVGDYSILLTKSILDFAIILVMAASMGKGCIFSAIPVAILQGGITLLAGLLSPLLNTHALDCLSLVGNLLILCIGMNIMLGDKFHIKVANLLPSIVVAIALSYLPLL